MAVLERVLLSSVERDLDEVIELAIDEAVLKLPASRPGSDRRVSSIAERYEWVRGPANRWATALPRLSTTGALVPAVETILKLAPL